MAASPAAQVETERLILRPLTSANVDDWATTIFSDVEVMRYVPKSDLPPRELAESLARRTEQAWEQGRLGHWAVSLKHDGQFIGHTFVAYREATEEYELGYMFGKAHWGQGFATEAARAALRFAFDRTPADHIMAWIMPENQASRRVLEHLGFVYEQDAVYDNVTYARYAVLRNQSAPGDHLYRVTEG